MSRAYEETNLLYWMSRLLNDAGDPARSIESIAEQLQKILQFGWVAIRFANDSGGVSDLAGTTVVAGDVRCGRDVLKQFSDLIFAAPTGSK